MSKFINFIDTSTLPVDLIDIGVLQEQQVGKEKLCVHPKLMQLMTLDNHEFEL